MGPGVVKKDIKTWRDRVERGGAIEQRVRDLFGLKRDRHSFPSRPDILDFEKDVIGEIKSSEDDRVVLYANQIRKYIRMADTLNSTPSLNGERKEISVCFFIAIYDSKEELTDIYMLKRNHLEKLLEREMRNTRWRLISKDLLRRVNALDDKSQSLFLNEEPRSKLKSDILKGNYKGAYIRLCGGDLNEMCPKVSELKNSKGASIRLHSHSAEDKLLKTLRFRKES